MDQVECVVVGAGVVGLAVARALARAGREVLVLEAAAGLGAGTSGRGSGVIHAGLYYPSDSLKARFCLSGREQLYGYAAAQGVPHRRLGKLVVATSSAEEARLIEIAQRARANGVTDVSMLDGADAAAMEPALACAAALHSPSTGIVDVANLMQTLQADAEEFGAVCAFRAPFERAFVETSGFQLEIGGAAPMRLACRRLVNAAGHGASSVAGAIEGLGPEHVPNTHLAKGNYFTLNGGAPFSRLIYPMPVPGGVGTHLTIDLGGTVRFGPDVEWIDRLDYSVDPGRAAAFAADIRRWWPSLPDDTLRPSHAAIRPKLAAAGEPSRDFLIESAADHGVPGLVNLFGIESPGLTAALAIADHVHALAVRD